MSRLLLLAWRFDAEVQGRQVAAFDGNVKGTANLLFAAVECCLELLPEPGAVVLVPDRLDGRPAVRVTGVVAGNQVACEPDQAAGWERFVGLVDSMGATVGSSSGSGGILVVFAETDAA